MTTGLMWERFTSTLTGLLSDWTCEGKEREAPRVISNFLVVNGSGGIKWTLS